MTGAERAEVGRQGASVPRLGGFVRRCVCRHVGRLAGDHAVELRVGPNVMAELADSSMSRAGNRGCSSGHAFTEESARRALDTACLAAGMEVASAELIRLGSNGVFRVDADVIARVAPLVDLVENAEKQVAVARWLESVGFPATRALDIAQPITAEARVVTFWESVAPETVYAPISDVAALIRRLHELVPPGDLSLPELTPFGKPGSDLPDFPGLPNGESRFLRARYAWARETFSHLPFVLPRGVIHGDANVGNVLSDEQGNAVLIDLDSFSIGPREWDLVQTALFADRFGWHTPEEYRTFVEVYGYDITEWSGYSDLADMREIAMTTWLSKKAHESEGTLREAVKRINAIRTGASRRDWGAY